MVAGPGWGKYRRDLAALSQWAEGQGIAILDVQAEEEKTVLLSFGSKVLGRAGRVMLGEVLDWVLGETAGPILVTPEPHPASRAGVAETATAALESASNRSP